MKKNYKLLSHSIRKKIIEVLPGQEIIHSVYGVGYKFEQPVE